MKGQTKHALIKKASGYMKLLDRPLGVVINRHVLKLTEEVSTLILPGTNLE